MLYTSTPKISTRIQTAVSTIPIGRRESNHARTKSGITESSLKKENLPNCPITHPEKMPAIMAINIPPAPIASWEKPTAPSAITCGVIIIKNTTIPVRPAMSLCFLRRFFSIRLNGIRNATNRESIPMVQPKGVQKFGHQSQPNTSPGTVRQQKMEPSRMNGSTCIMESFKVVTQTLWFTAFILGAKSFSSQLINFFNVISPSFLYLNLYWSLLHLTEEMVDCLHSV